MKQIRKSVFETNSSSSHSLTIKNDGIVLTDIFEEGESYLLQLTDEFSSMSFETDWNHYSTHFQNPWQKMQYLYIYCLNRPKYFPSFRLAIREIEDEFKCKIDMDICVDPEIKKHCKYTNLRTEWLFDNCYTINHESADCLDDIFDKKQEEGVLYDFIKDIILNTKYIIQNDVEM